MRDSPRVPCDSPRVPCDSPRVLCDLNLDSDVRELNDLMHGVLHNNNKNKNNNLLITMQNNY